MATETRRELLQPQAGRLLPQGNWPQVEGPLAAPSSTGTGSGFCLLTAWWEPRWTSCQPLGRGSAVALCHLSLRLLWWQPVCLPTSGTIDRSASHLWHSRRQCPAVCKHAELEGAHSNDLLPLWLAQAFPWSPSAVLHQAPQAFITTLSPSPVPMV